MKICIRSNNLDLNAKPLKKSDYIKGADDPEDMAQGGRAGVNGTETPSIKYDFDREQGIGT